MFFDVFWWFGSVVFLLGVCKKQAVFCQTIPRVEMVTKSRRRSEKPGFGACCFHQEARFFFQQKTGSYG